MPRYLHDAPFPRDGANLHEKTMTSLRVLDRFRVPKIVWIWLERLELTPMAVLRHARLPSALYDGERTAVTTTQRPIAAGSCGRWAPSRLRTWYAWRIASASPQRAAAIPRYRSIPWYDRPLASVPLVSPRAKEDL